MNINGVLKCVSLSVLVAGCQTPRSAVRQPVPADLVLYYDFNEPITTSVFDNSPGQHHGIPHQVSSTKPGVAGRAGWFDGIQSYVEVPDMQLPTEAGEFTVMAWVQFAALGSAPGSPSGPCGGVGCDQSIINQMLATGVGIGPNTAGWRLLKQADNRFWFCLGMPYNGCQPNAPTTVRSTSVAETGHWYHVTAVKSAGAIALYVNGELEQSKMLTVPVATGMAPLLIGYYPHESYMYGWIDEVRLYRRALKPEEITRQFQAEFKSLRVNAQ